MHYGSPRRFYKQLSEWQTWVCLRPSRKLYTFLEQCFFHHINAVQYYDICCSKLQWQNMTIFLVQICHDFKCRLFRYKCWFSGHNKEKVIIKMLTISKNGKPSWAKLSQWTLEIFNNHSCTFPTKRISFYIKQPMGVEAFMKRNNLNLHSWTKEEGIHPVFLLNVCFWFAHNVLEGSHFGVVLKPPQPPQTTTPLTTRRMRAQNQIVSKIGTWCSNTAPIRIHAALFVLVWTCICKLCFSGVVLKTSLFPPFLMSPTPPPNSKILTL